MDWKKKFTVLSESQADSFEFGKGATDEEIRAAEQRIGLKLPASYRSFLRSVGWLSAGPLELKGLGHDVPHRQNLVETMQRERSIASPHLAATLIPLMNSGAGDYYCLDTSGGGRRSRMPRRVVVSRGRRKSTSGGSRS